MYIFVTLVFERMLVLKGAQKEIGQWYSNPQAQPLKTAKSGVGKYITKAAADAGSVESTPGANIN